MSETKPPFRRQFVNFAFYKVNPDWRLLEEHVQEKYKEEFIEVLQKFSSKIILVPYSVLGLRAECDFMLWRISYQLEDFEQMTAEMYKTGFGRYIASVYSYLSMTKRSSYIDRISPDHIESRTQVKPGKYKYNFVYPFVKKREWYLLPLDKRQAMMDEHIRIGNKYPSVKLNTTYSFGLDDQEFVVAFETDSPQDFLDLVMELRESVASSYTLRDTPTFTCIAKTAQGLLADF